MTIFLRSIDTVMTHKSFNDDTDKIQTNRRDFSCKCGKSYLSYPAAYTHVKNKHQLDREYVEAIQRPKQQILRKGRPKNRTYRNQSLEFTLLTLVERTILKMYNLLQGKFEYIILQDNDSRNVDQFQRNFKALCEDKYQQLFEYDLRDSQEMEQFIRQMNKDFSCAVAARVRLVCLLIGKMQNQSQTRQLDSHLTKLNLWLGQDSINQLIFQTYQEWKTLNKIQTKQQL